MSDTSPSQASDAIQTQPAMIAPTMDEAISRRRAQLQADPDIAYLRPDSLMGVAFSGGGIRSSTISLGVAQAFAKYNRLLDFDYCSTVSGGGYFGSFMTSLFMPDSIRGNAPRPQPDPALPQDRPKDTAQFALKVLADNAQQEEIDDPFNPAGGRIRHPLWWLRQHSRYMAPNGPSDYQAAITYFIRNWSGLMFVIIAALAMLFATSTALTTIIYHWRSNTADIFSFTGHLVEDCASACMTVDGKHYFRWSVSPLVVLPLFGYALCAVFAEAYWLTIWAERGATHYFFLIKAKGAPSRWRLNANCVVLALVTGIPAWAFSPAGVMSGKAVQAHWQLASSVVLGVMAVSSLTQLLLVLFIDSHYLPSADPQIKDDGNAQSTDGIAPLIVEIRRRLTRSLSLLLLCSTIGLLLVVLGALGRAAYSFASGGQGWAGAGLLVLAPVASTIVAKAPKWFGDGRLAAFLGRQIWNIALVAAILLYALLAIAVDVGVQALAFDGPEWTRTDYWKGGNYSWSSSPPYFNSMFWTWLMISVMFFITGSFPAFLNLSSLHGLYGTRLTRAFLGAGNVVRLRNKSSGPTDSDPGDQIPMAAYQHAAMSNQTFAPFHLVNTTLNETVSPTRSQLLERDRKGVPLVFAPEGAFLAARSKQDEAISWKELDQAEALSVGQLCAISGAAFSSGMGMNTTLGGSLMLVFANIRLGYWWHVRDALAQSLPPYTPPNTILAWLWRRIPPTYAHLLLEMFGMYFRSGDYVNISDGGHFENTGAYEMLRRKVPTILVCDNGQDHACAFEDMENLIRKARIDLGMEISVPSHSEVARIIDAAGAQLFLNTDSGDWRDGLLARAPLGSSAPASQKAFCLLLKVVDCSDPNWKGHILWMKPCLFDGVPEDVLGYGRRNPNFPQQSTLDQFFDEAQWESYRKLGFTMGSKLLTETVHADRVLSHLATKGTPFP